MNNKDQDHYIHISKLSRKKRRFSKISSRLSLIVGENKHVTLLARRDLIVQRPAENILYRPVKISLISWGKLQPLSRWNLAGHASRISLTSQDRPYLKYALDACKPSTPSCVFEARGGILLFLSSNPVRHRTLRILLEEENFTKR